MSPGKGSERLLPGNRECQNRIKFGLNFSTSVHRSIAPSIDRLVIGSQMWMLHGGSSTRERTLGPRGVGMIVLKEGVLNTLQKNAESSRLPREACSGSSKHHEIGMDLSPRPFLMRQIPCLHRQFPIDPDDNHPIGDGVFRNETNGARSGGHGVDDPRV
jgi:hypothetical protein